MQPAAGTDFIAMNGAGGTAIVSASSCAPSIHVSVVFNGIFSPEEFSDVPVVVRLESLEKQQVVLQEVSITSSQPYVNNICIINA
jgi:chordin